MMVYVDVRSIQHRFHSKERKWFVDIGCMNYCNEGIQIGRNRPRNITPLRVNRWTRISEGLTSDDDPRQV